MTRTIQPGDRVAYAARFLRSIACHTGPVPFLRGSVTAVRAIAGMTLATVEWHDGTTDTVNVANIVRVDDMHLECVQ